MNKTVPVILNNEQVGTMALNPEAITRLEELMELKFEDFEAEPFTISFAFDVSTNPDKCKIVEAVITTWSEE